MTHNQNSINLPTDKYSGVREHRGCLTSQRETFAKAKRGGTAALTFIFIVIAGFVIIIEYWCFEISSEGKMIDTTGKLKIDILTIRMWKKIEANCRKTATSSFFLS